MIIDDVEKIREKLNMEKDTFVKVGLFGQPGCGKSSLINALVGEKVAKPGVENDMIPGNPIEWEGLLFVDLPGFDTQKFPRDNYFEKFDIQEFDLILCVFEGKWRETDSEFFKRVIKMDKPCLFVRNKYDTLWEDGFTEEELKTRIINDVRKLASADVDVYFTSCRKKTGLKELTEAIFRILEPAKKDKWVRQAKAYSREFLEKKRNACEKYVALGAVTSAANGLNPIPGVDVAVDMSVMFKLFSEIRKSFGLNDEVLIAVERFAPELGCISSKIIQWSAIEGIGILLSKFIGKKTLKKFSKHSQFIHQAIAAGTGFALTWNAGYMFLDYCYKISSAILDKELSDSCAAK